MAEEKKAYHEKFAEQVIQQIENGTAPWMKPWEPGQAFMPYNPSSGTVYKGGNKVFLAMQGFDDPRWKTFNQVKKDGQRVRKGEHGTPIVFWQWEKEKNRTDDAGRPVLDKSGQPEKVKVQLEKPIIRASYVFNGSQIEGIEPWVAPEKPYPWDPIEKAEKILERSEAPIHHDQRDQAFYRMSTDSIHLPPQESFRSQAGYYDTALHEFAHSTRHETRLHRDSGPFGSEAYAREELRAEIASWMISAEIGIPHDTGNHASYIKSWQKALEDDPFEIIRACRDAENILAYTIGREFAMERDESLDKKIQDAPASAQEQRVPAQDESRLPLEEKKIQSDARTYLNVPYKERIQAKEAGAKWDWQQQSWYAPGGTDLAALKKWIPEQEKERPAPIDPRIEFGRFIEEAGGELQGQLPAMDGQIHRIRAAGSKTNPASFAYCGYADGIANGWIHNYKSGEQGKWVATGHTITEKEKADLAAQAKARREELEKERAERQDRAAEECRNLFEARHPAQSDHPYLLKKGIQPEGLKASRDGLSLIAPLVNTDGKIRSLQYIHPDGSKRFHAEAEKSGNFFLLGARLPEDGKSLASSEIVLCEGVATGQTLREAVGKPVAVCFDSGNLEKVAMKLREKFPNAAITICADNDHKQAMNVGVVKAQRAAAKVQGKVIVPFLNEQEKTRGFTDFNDLKALHGISEVRRQVSKGLQLKRERDTGLRL